MKSFALTVIIGVLLLTALIGIAAIARADEPAKKTQFCLVLDKAQEFSRCETAEVICYRFGKFYNCYARPQTPAPVATPLPTPKAEVGDVSKKK